MANFSQQYKNILDNTVAVVFYSTPHMGSKLTYYDKGYLDVIFRYSWMRNKYDFSNTDMHLISTEALPQWLS